MTEQTVRPPAEEEKAEGQPPVDDAGEAVGQKDSFAKGMGFYKLFWVFFIGCFLRLFFRYTFILIVLFLLEWCQWFGTHLWSI